MFLKDLFLPKFCLGCGFLGAYICLNCKKKLSYIKSDDCLYCGKASLYGLTHPGCRRINGIDGFLSLFYYNNFLKKLIKDIKYRLATEVWQELCLVVKPEKCGKFKQIKDLLGSNLLLVPVPLHPNKLRARGFNQAKIISLFFNRFLHLSQTEPLLRKIDTKAQAQLKKNLDRYLNLRNAFAVLPGNDFSGKKFVLVDDVATTGSTLKEAARALKGAGAKKVYAFVLAKG